MSGVHDRQSNVNIDNNDAADENASKSDNRKPEAVAATEPDLG